MTTGHETDPATVRGELAPHGLGYLLGIAQRARRRAWEAELADLGLTAPQAALLRLIAAQPGSGVRRLARELGTDPMNTQRISETLIAAGLCETRRDAGDARRRPLHPTGRGWELADVVARRAADSEQQLAAALGASAYHTLVAGLHDLLDHDQDHAPDDRVLRAARARRVPKAGKAQQLGTG
jgi:DNA-binding MarR family transcriptional regulator